MLNYVSNEIAFLCDSVNPLDKEMCIPGSPSVAVRKYIPCHCWRDLAFRQEVPPEGMLLPPNGLCIETVVCVYTLCFMLEWNTYICIHVFPYTSMLLSEIKLYHLLLPFPPLSPSQLPSLESSHASPQVDSCSFFDCYIYTYLRMDIYTHIYCTYICDDGKVVPNCCIWVGLFDCSSPLAAYIVFPGTLKPDLRKEALSQVRFLSRDVSWVCDVSSNRAKNIKAD